MALQKTKLLKNGLTLTEGYHRVDTVSGYKGEITISVNSYVSKESFEAGLPYVEQEFYNFKPVVENSAKEMWTQAYEFLKTEDTFKGSKDC